MTPMFCCSIKQVPLRWVTVWLQNLFRQKELQKSNLQMQRRLASLADETPEGRSVVILAKEQFNIRGREMQASDTVFYSFYCTNQDERYRFAKSRRSTSQYPERRC